MRPETTETSETSETIETPEPAAETATDAPVAVTPTDYATLPTLSVAFATTPKRGTARKVPKEPATLLAYAIEQGGRVELTPKTEQDLTARGLPVHRISNAAYGIRKCFAKDVRTERQGRKVCAYVIAI